MKTYIKPETKIVALKTINMMAVSGGIANGSTVGRSFNGSDVTYGREENSWDIWGSADVEEE